ncbi:MAG TPA: dynamin family protein [Chthoniobacteraceae bacterium]|jgi:hypothetical protein
MKTEIARFCEVCLNALNPLRPALKTAADQLESSGEKALLQPPLVALNDVRARLRSLLDKLASQQAYLLIFGPLKSGKSTLMNAISGSYVSEVSSLPGYPCLVYVQHSEKPHFSVTRYNGRESVFADAIVLKDVIADSHLALAQQIRQAEQRGDDFDPRNHFTEAIRRIDVKVPVQSLGESSTVLVDTPGLYSRMNFGYDVLTREFRDSAACAVFVVKTDNLFLEQVFAEFNQLLGLFSRIFLVINVDSSKRDLQADGSLQPSAESQHPEQIIEAFRTLSMAGPMRKAYEDKRVRIHAVDLLSAASAFLTRNGSAAGPAVQVQKNAFDAFLRDLTDYLNSSDYTLEFIRDSLRQGQTLCAESRALVAGDETRLLGEKQTELGRQMSELDERIAAVDRLLKVDWDETFEKVRAENTSRVSGTARARAAQLAKDLRQALQNWYGANHSLKALEEQHWNPLLTSAAQSLADESHARLSALLGTSLGGAEPAASVMTDLHAVNFRLGPAAQAALPALSQKELIEPYKLELKDEEIPVRKSIGDWLLFRKIATVRRRLFGENLQQEIEPAIKQQRLPEKSRETFLRLIDVAVQEKFPSLPTGHAEELLKGYVARFREEVLQGLRAHREQLGKNRAQCQTPFDRNAQALSALRELDQQAGKVATALDALSAQENGNLPSVPLTTIPPPKPALEDASL